MHTYVMLTMRLVEADSILR